MFCYNLYSGGDNMSTAESWEHLDPGGASPVLCTDPGGTGPTLDPGGVAPSMDSGVI